MVDTKRPRRWKRGSVRYRVVINWACTPSEVQRRRQARRLHTQPQSWLHIPGSPPSGASRHGQDDTGSSIGGVTDETPSRAVGFCVGRPTRDRRETPARRGPGTFFELSAFCAQDESKLGQAVRRLRCALSRNSATRQDDGRSCAFHTNGPRVPISSGADSGTFGPRLGTPCPPPYDFDAWH
jgi:hypothetical protein